MVHRRGQGQRPQNPPQSFPEHQVRLELQDAVFEFVPHAGECARRPGGIEAGERAASTGFVGVGRMQQLAGVETRELDHRRHLPDAGEGPFPESIDENLLGGLQCAQAPLQFARVLLGGIVPTTRAVPVPDGATQRPARLSERLGQAGSCGPTSRPGRFSAAPPAPRAPAWRRGPGFVRRRPCRVRRSARSAVFPAFACEAGGPGAARAWLRCRRSAKRSGSGCPRARGRVARGPTPGRRSGGSWTR